MASGGISYIKRYLKHWFSAKHSGGFGVHSPFAYHFITAVIEEKNPYYCFQRIEKMRENLLNDKQSIYVTDYGTGPTCNKRICDIAAKSLKNAKLAQTIFRIALSNRSKDILELGTSLGITTLYLASTDSSARVTSLEGSGEVAAVASRVLKNGGASNVEIIKGDIDVTLEEALTHHKHLDLVFFDANHRYEPTMRYFEKCLQKVTDNTIFIFDDINHSSGMEKAWEEIKRNFRVRVTMDFFHIGVVFFNKKLQREHYKIRL